MTDKERLCGVRLVLQRIAFGNHDGVGARCSSECPKCLAASALDRDNALFDPEVLAYEAVTMGQDVDRVRAKVAKAIREAYERGKKDAGQT